MKLMKNKGLIITLIILLTIIIFFLVMFLVAGIRGGEGFFMRIGSKEKKIFYDETFPLESINSIDIKQNAGDIIFKETESNHIQVVLQG